MKHILLYIILTNSLIAGAQQLPLYSQYMFNPLVYNPSFAGNEGTSIINLTAREQWVGIPGAPKYHSASFHGRLKKHFNLVQNVMKKAGMNVSSGNVGLGGNIYNDRFGLTLRTGAQFAYAYHIYIKKTQLSFGLALNLFQMRLDRNSAITVDEIEPVLLSDNARSIFVPDANVGISLKNRKYFLGLSVVSLMQSLAKMGNDNLFSYQLMRHYYLTGGLNFYSGNYTIRPSLLLKTTEKFDFKIDMQTDVSCLVYYKERFWGGMTYRTNGDIIAMMGLSFQSFLVGYAFDCPTSRIVRNSYGTHELSVSYVLGNISRRIKSSERL
jgi:type IX secretion system PorP/SprF family membrane protein